MIAYFRERRIAKFVQGICHKCDGPLTGLLPQAPGSGWDERACDGCMVVWSHHEQHSTQPDIRRSGSRLARWPALAAATGTAKTAQRVECEASQSGGEAVTPEISPTSPHTPRGT
jgi:hypothetical protein